MTTSFIACGAMPSGQYFPHFYDDVLQISRRGEWVDFSTIKTQDDAELAVNIVTSGKFDGAPGRFRIRRNRKETIIETQE